MKTIHKIEATERILQVHYYQFFNSLPFCLNSDYDIDIIGINEKYPGFLETFDFANVDVYDLNKFIRIKTRLTHWYSDPNELSNSDFSLMSSCPVHAHSSSRSNARHSQLLLDHFQTDRLLLQFP